MKIFVTRYALAKGILAMEAELPKDNPGMAIVRGSSVGPGHLDMYFHGSDWHRNWESAEAHAYAMVESAIKSAKKKIKKLEDLTFRNPERESA